MSKQSRLARSRARRRSRAGAFILIGFCAALVAAVAALLWSQAPVRIVATDAAAPGRLVAEQPTVDLGHVPFDQLKEARFELDNTGGDIVRLVGAPKVRMLEGC